jgi:hypothetical protein
MARACSWWADSAGRPTTPTPSASTSVPRRSTLSLSPLSLSLSLHLSTVVGKRTDTREWSELAVPVGFTGRRGHRAAVIEMDGEGVMVVHGGRDKSGPLADLHLFRFGVRTRLAGLWYALRERHISLALALLCTHTSQPTSHGARWRRTTRKNRKRDQRHRHGHQAATSTPSTRGLTVFGFVHRLWSLCDVSLKCMSPCEAHCGAIRCSEVLAWMCTTTICKEEPNRAT